MKPEWRKIEADSRDGGFRGRGSAVSLQWGSGRSPDRLTGFHYFQHYRMASHDTVIL